MESENELVGSMRSALNEQDPIAGVRVIHQEHNRNIETATAVLPLEPPESGDFHESLTVPDGSGDVAVLLGDVTGHGASAAQNADKIRRSAIASLKAGKSPIETVKIANEEAQSEDDRYATLFVAKINSETGDVAYANAGHEPPILSTDDGHTSHLITTGPPLGVLSPEIKAYTEEHTQLPRGGTMLITTDGIVEARDPGGNRTSFFGYERLIELLRTLSHSSPVKLVTSVIGKVIHFTKSKLHDDIVVTAVRRRKHNTKVRDGSPH